MKKIGLIIVIILILIAGGVYFFLNKNKKTPPQPLGEQIYTNIATSSSSQAQSKLDEKLPDTNPFAVETNPAKKAYPNPFDRL